MQVKAAERFRLRLVDGFDSDHLDVATFQVPAFTFASLAAFCSRISLCELYALGWPFLIFVLFAPFCGYSVLFLNL